MGEHEPRLTHLDAAGRAVMVDISAKAVTDRQAVAGARVVMRAETLRRIVSGETPKGDVFAAARIAGIMAAKRTAELIPLCHPLPISAVTVVLKAGALAADAGAVEIEATVRTTGRTGVEMEALTAASVAALTIYDMCKAIDRGMRIEALRVKHKSGGASGSYDEEPAP